jgi:hypothetical protein
MFPWNLFPFNKQMKQMDPNNMNQYIQDMMKNMFPNGLEGMMNPDDMLKGSQGFINPFNTMSDSEVDSANTSPSKNLQIHVFESHEHVFLRFPISDEVWLKQLKIFHTSNQAIIENIPTIGERQVITLPSLVKKKGATANFKDGILELKIPRSIDMQYSEVDISEKY